MSEIIGIVRQQELAGGSKSDGVHTYLEVMGRGELYKLYRKEVYPIDDIYFDQFKDKNVVIDGDIQHEEWVMVESIELNNAEL